VRPVLIKRSPALVKGCTSSRIGPHRLEIDLPLEFGDRSPATQTGNAVAPQPCATKDAYLLRVYHGSRRASSLGGTRRSILRDRESSYIADVLTPRAI
jgi:hypothetical protein